MINRPTKAVILAGGLGTRLSEETELRPKPMVEIGGMPILWHIMKIYSHFGVNEFIICLGYKGYIVKEYFTNYYRHKSDITVDLTNNSVEIHESRTEPWKISLIDTGADTLTGGRLKRVSPYVGSQPFCFTYGDGVSDINIETLFKFHQSHKKIGTMSAVRPLSRYGALEINPEGTVTQFKEKPVEEGGYINGGFFILQPEVFDYIEGDQTSFEGAPLEKLVQDQQLSAYCHDGFWQPMDTLREKNLLESLWCQGKAPWKLWK